MRNDSIETLLLRHYGSGAQGPSGLEGRLCASLHEEVDELGKQHRMITQLAERPMSRRHAVRLVAIGTAGLGGLSLALEGLRMIETALLGQDTTQPAAANV